jgi:hypothetical protein
MITKVPQKKNGAFFLGPQQPQGIVAVSRVRPCRGHPDTGDEVM